MLIYDNNGKAIGELYDRESDFSQYAPVTPPKSKVKVALCIGHQSNNQGAYGSEGIGEWQYNKDLIESLTQDFYAMSNVEIKVFMRDKNISGYSNQMRDLHQKLDNWGAEISIEFHFNSFSNSSAQGHEVLYCSQSSGEIASKLNNKLDMYLPTTNRGIKKVTSSDRGGGFCCRGASKAIILEPFFSAHQYKFVPGGELYQPLRRAILDFLKEL